MPSKNPIKYGFNERLAFSQSESSNGEVGSILVAHVPTAVRAWVATKEQDKTGIDWFVELSSGRVVGVDCKIREEDYSLRDPAKDDVALETWSKVEQRKVGWTLDESKRCDYILWLWKDTGRWMLVPFLYLLEVFRENKRKWIQQYGESTQFTPSKNAWHSNCIFVPRKELWAEIYKKFGGAGRIKKPTQKVYEPEAGSAEWFLETEK